MTYGQNNDNHQRKVKAQVKAHGGPLSGVLNGVVSWINSLAGHLPGFLQGPFRVWVKVESFVPDLIAKEWDWIYHSLLRLDTWILVTLPRLLRREIGRAVRQLQAWVIGKLRQLRALSWRLYYLAVTYALNLFAHERRARIRADERDRADARAWDKALHQQLEREAVSGYKASRSQRLDLIQRVADLIVTDDPIVKRLVGDLVTGVLDLASIDDPIARIGLTFVIKHVIDRLGIDKPVGLLLQQLLTPILGAPKPNGLASVIADICGRLDALESTWADFMAAGGAEVEQAGSQWQELTRPLADLGLVAFVGQAVADPTAWASEVNDTIGLVVSDSLLAITDLIMKG